MRKKVVIVSIVILSGALIYLFLYIWAKADLGGFTPDSATSTTMYGIKRRILHYTKENNRLPSSVEQLPLLEGFDNRNTDYWGGKIIIQIDGTNVTLTSYGKDKKPGGTGANLDLISVFDAKASSGEWANENDEGYPSWKRQPVIRWNKADYQ